MSETTKQKKRTRSMGELGVYLGIEQQGGQNAWLLVSGGTKFADTREAKKYIEEHAGDGEYLIARDVSRVTVETATVTTRTVKEA